MIARLQGRVVEKSPELVLLDVNGVGYELQVPLSTFLELADKGSDVTLRVHTHVREDILALYGFLTESERAGFRLLIRISGVGPRMAIAILSGIPVAELAHAVRDGNAAVLRGIPGVGPKTADRILIELKDKFRGFAVEIGAPAGSEIEASTISALENLGYPRGQAEKVVRAAIERLSRESSSGENGGEPTLEELVREALRGQSR